MTAGHPLGLVDAAEANLLRSTVTMFVQALMGAEADTLCGGAHRARDEERVNTRSGYRPREWDIRAGTIEVAIPCCGAGSYFPDWLLERAPRRAGPGHGGGDLLPARGVHPADDDRGHPREWGSPRSGCPFA